jgi:hypothetical protein
VVSRHREKEILMKEYKLGDLIPNDWVIKKIKNLRFYDKEGHLLLELCDDEEEGENGDKITCSGKP